MLKLTTDKHEASRGLSATAELLVLSTSSSFAFEYPGQRDRFQLILSHIYIGYIQTDNYSNSSTVYQRLAENLLFITVRKAHSKVTHIKQQYFHHVKDRGYNTQTILDVMTNILLFFMCHFAACEPYTLLYKN